MTRRRKWLTLGLPLLAKELFEQAGRRRTYVIRLAYASLLFLIAYWQFDFILAAGGQGTLGVLGHGRRMFQGVVLIQFFGILLFLPAMTCGTVAQEKERNSLALILITRQGPVTILLQKLLSRLIPMFTFLLLSMPLMAFAYSLGGVTRIELFSGIWLLGLICIHVGTLALMCSSWCSTTVAAFVGTYSIGFGTWFPCVCCLTAASGPTGGLLTLAPQNILLVEIQSSALLSSSVLYFMLAAAFLLPRSQAAPRNMLLGLFRELDRFFVWLNGWTTGGVVLIRERDELPGDEPIAWRETVKRSLGQARYLVRILVTVELPLVLILAALAGATYQIKLGAASTALYIIWAIAILLIAVQATSLVSIERTQQSLDLLLAAPLTGREIIRQKFHGIRRLQIVLGVPLATVLVFEAWFASGTPGLEDGGRASLTVPIHAALATFEHFDYSLCAALSIVVYLPLVAWISFYIGAQIRSQVRAIMVVLVLLFGWALLPPILADSLSPGLGRDMLDNPAQALVGLVASPSTMIYLNETRGPRPGEYRMMILGLTVANFLFYGLLWWGLRRSCLSRSDALLGRVGGEPA